MGIISALLPELSPRISPWGYTLFPRVMAMNHVCEVWAEIWKFEAHREDFLEQCKTWIIFSHSGLKEGESLRVFIPAKGDYVLGNTCWRVVSINKWHRHDGIKSNVEGEPHEVIWSGGGEGAVKTAASGCMWNPVVSTTNNHPTTGLVR